MKLLTMLETAFETGGMEASTKAQVELFNCVKETIKTGLSHFKVEANFNAARAAFHEKIGVKKDFEETLKTLLEETTSNFIYSFLNLESLSFSNNLAFYYTVLLMLQVESEDSPSINGNTVATFTKFAAAITLPVLKDYLDHYGEAKFAKVELSPQDIENYEFLGYFPIRYEQFSQAQLPYFLSKLLKLKALSNPN